MKGKSKAKLLSSKQLLVTPIFKVTDNLARDPFVIHGAARCDVVEFAPSMTAPGAEVLKTL